MECAAYFEAECAFGSCGEEFFTCGVDGFDFAGDDDLSGAVVVGAYDGAGNFGADLLDGFVGECEYGSHCGGVELACFLHGVCAGCDEAEAVFKGHCSGCDECGEFAEGVAGYHVGVEVGAECLGEDYGVEEDGGLGDGGLTEVFVGAVEHEVGDAEAEDFVGFLKHVAGYGVVVVEVFAHAYELGALAGEYKCFHFLVGFFWLGQRYENNFEFGILDFECGLAGGFLRLRVGTGLE